MFLLAAAGHVTHLHILSLFKLKKTDLPVSATRGSLFCEVHSLLPLAFFWLRPELLKPRPLSVL